MDAPLSKSRQRKRDALKLLEWALEDMSPANPRHQLHFKCGFEREGHFIPQPIPSPPNKNRDDWKNEINYEMEKYAAQMGKALGDEHGMERVYHDRSGTFLLEAVTKKLGLVDAVDAIENISQKMLGQAEKMKLRLACFGPVPFDDAYKSMTAAGDGKNIPNGPENAMVDYAGEVFDVPGQGKTLVGRGQHCNLSIWSGNNNLFQRKGSGDDLVHHAAAKALEWLPYMFLPCRKGNYYRIHGGSKIGLKYFSASDFETGVDTTKSMGPAIRYTANPCGLRSWSPYSYRLEFRQGAPEADPYDVALASALPLVKACDESLKKDNGKIVVNNMGMTSVTEEKWFPGGYRKPIFKTEEEAKEAFNSKDNPYFKYLDELAQRKIKKAEARHKQENGPESLKALQEAQSLSTLASDLYKDYCREYQIKPRQLETGSRIAI